MPDLLQRCGQRRIVVKRPRRTIALIGCALSNVPGPGRREGWQRRQPLLSAPWPAPMHWRSPRPAARQATGSSSSGTSAHTVSASSRWGFKKSAVWKPSSAGSATICGRCSSAASASSTVRAGAASCRVRQTRRRARRRGLRRPCRDGTCSKRTDAHWSASVCIGACRNACCPSSADGNRDGPAAARLASWIAARCAEQRRRPGLACRSARRSVSGRRQRRRRNRWATDKGLIFRVSKGARAGRRTILV